MSRGYTQWIAKKNFHPCKYSWEMGTLWKYLLAELVVVFLILPNLAATCDGVSTKYGNMTKDYDLEVGSRLTVQCTLFTNVIPNNGTEYYVTSENLMIKFGNNFLTKLDIIDEYTVEYTVEKATVNDTGIYNCFLSVPELSFNPFVCTTYIAVGYRPLQVKNVRCISYNYERLNCTWEKPFNPVKTKYTLFDLVGHIRIRRMCPIALDSSCEFRLDSFPPYRKSAKILYLTLVGNNSLGKIEQHVTVDHFKIVKPSHPKRITFTNVTKNSALVHWLPPKGMEYNDFPPGITYSLHYCPLYGDYPELCGVVSQKNSTSLLVTNLVPYIEYKFMLRCRSNVADSDDMWSPFVNSSVRTEPDIPYLAPEMAVSSFQVQKTQYTRAITLYWKPIRPCYQNGRDFHYVIQYHTHYIPHRAKRSTYEVELGNQTSHLFTHMDPDSAYMFRVFAKNSIGISANSSLIVIDKEERLLHGPTDISILSYGQGKYSISWKNSDQNYGLAVHNYTLFWCQNIKPRPFKCEGPLNWKIVTDTKLEMNLSDSSTNYQFAVAANGYYTTSGMKWASCVVPYHGVLYKVNDVIVTPKNSTSVRVHWMLDCGAQKNVVLEYAISYCAMLANHSCSGKPLVAHVKNPLSEQYIVGGLEPFTKYRFTVAARTTDGWSEDSSVKYETTMSAAPSDSPQDVELLNVNGTVIRISFRPPTKPNGEITRYSVHYGKSSSATSEKHKIDFPVDKSADVYEAEINRSGIYLYTNYSIEVEACVDLACSPRSSPVYAFTGIGAPGPLDPPHTELLNSTLVNVTWRAPRMPNGPIDFYQLTMVWQESDVYDTESAEIMREVFNISGQDNYLSVSVDCQQEITDGLVYYFSVQAVNVRNGVFLYSQPSEPTQTRLCFINSGGLSYRILIGLIIGIAFGLTLLVFLIYGLAKWMKRKVDMVKGITVQLPTGLDSPIENPLNTYDKFKSGLQENGDAGIPSEKNYERLCSYTSDKLSKDIEISFDSSCEEILNSNRGREKTGRNRSGDSNASGKGHDSISSNTNKTHLSIDSGAEMDLPPSPDGIFSDTSSSNTTPRSYKPDLEIVEENNPSSSKDSGLEKEGISRVASIGNGTHVLDHQSRFPYYMRKKGHSYFNAPSLKKNGQMQPYSKFAIIAPVFTPNYVSVGVHNVLLDQQSLSNSEPSVAEFPDDSDSEPLMMSGVPPYCRFGLARSAGNGLNITNQLLPIQESIGYSKFGIIYSALGKPSSSNLQHAVGPANYSKIVCPKIIPNLNNMPSLGHSLPSHKKPLKVVEEQPYSPTENMPVCNDQVSPLNNQNGPQCHLAAEKASRNGHFPEIPKPGTANGYVSFNHALSDLGGIVNGIPELQSPGMACSKPNGYVSFQDAKGMSQHDIQPEYDESSQDNGLPDDTTLNLPLGQIGNIVQLNEESPEDKQEPLLELSDIKLPVQDIEIESVPFTVSNSCCNDDSCSQEFKGLQLKDSSDGDLCQIFSRESFDSDSSANPAVDASEHSALPNNQTEGTPHGTSNPNSEIAIFLQPLDHSTSQGLSKHQPTSNGYVTWSELLGTNPAEVITLPSGTKGLHVEHI